MVLVRFVTTVDKVAVLLFLPAKAGYESGSRASLLETLLTAQTRLVLQTATHRRQKRSTQTDTKTGSFLIAAAALKIPTRNGYN